MPDQFYIWDLHGVFWRYYYAKMTPLSTPCPNCGGADPVEYDIATGQGPCDHCNGSGREPTKATYLVTKALLKTLRERQPAYFAIAGDVPRHTLRRRAIWPGYKGSRDVDATPWDAKIQLARVYQILNLLGLCVLQVNGYEADDIIATLATSCVSDDVGVTIVSRDNDLEQLCNDPRIRLYDPLEDVFVDRAAIVHKRGITPDKLSEIKALTGESGDDIPGVPGLGPVKGLKLIQQYGTCENVIASASELTPKLSEAVINNAHIVRIARQLVELDKAVPLSITSNNLICNQPNLEPAKPLFRALGFHRWE